LLWELLSKMLTFDRNDRISASDALKLPFFTGPQALAEITPEIHQFASAAQTAMQRGDISVSIYDTNINFIIPVSSVMPFIGVDTDDETQINSLPSSYPVQQQIPIPSEQKLDSNQQLLIKQQQLYQSVFDLGQSIVFPNQNYTNQGNDFQLQPTSDSVQQQIPIPANTQKLSGNLNSLQQMSLVQPDVTHGVLIGQSSIIPKPSSKQQSKPKSKAQQTQQAVPPSLNPNMLVGIIPDKENAYQEGSKIIRTVKGYFSSVAFNPVIQSGIVRFGGFFERHQNSNFMIGICDSSVVFGSDEWPCSDEIEKKNVRYWKDGELSHIGDGMDGNSRIEMNKTISMEVNMKISPRTLTFFYDNQEQPVSVTNIPSSIRFYIYLVDQNSSFTINRFENLQFSSAKGVSCGKVFEWGKEWKK
ncbi:MAG: hypothetical protein EZS28_037425, partial [Streblomastix strix]